MYWLAAKFGIWDVDGEHGFAQTISAQQAQRWIAFYGVKAEKEKQSMDTTKEA